VLFKVCWQSGTEHNALGFAKCIVSPCKVLKISLFLNNGWVRALPFPRFFVDSLQDWTEFEEESSWGVAASILSSGLTSNFVNVDSCTHVPVLSSIPGFIVGSGCTFVARTSEFISIGMRGVNLS
jgi:hypothetical protein